MAPETPPSASFSEERYSRFLDTAPDAMVVVGEDGRILLVNVQTERVFGYSRPELLGQPITILIPERFRAGHGAHEARFFANPTARSMGASLQLFGRRKDGTDIPIEVSLSPLHTEQGMTVSAAIRDVTERKAIEADAKRSADRLASAVDTIQDAFALFDDADRLVLCNSVYRRLLGDFVTGPIVGRSYADLLEAWVQDLDFPDQAAREGFRLDRLARRRQVDAGRTIALDPAAAVAVRTARSLDACLGRRRAAEGTPRPPRGGLDGEPRSTPWRTPHRSPRPAGPLRRRLRRCARRSEDPGRPSECAPCPPYCRRASRRRR